MDVQASNIEDVVTLRRSVRFSSAVYVLDITLVRSLFTHKDGESDAFYKSNVDLAPMFPADGRKRAHENGRSTMQSGEAFTSLNFPIHRCLGPMIVPWLL